MHNFVCRICGNNKYSILAPFNTIDINHQEFTVPELSECTNCSAVFTFPEKFSLPTIGYNLMHKNAQPPSKANTGDSGFDVHAIDGTVIPAKTAKLVGTGLCLDIPENIECQVRPRSGLSKYLIILNSPGTVDNQYKGEIKVRLYNHTDEDYNIAIGDRIAQLVFTPSSQYELRVFTEIGNSDRGIGGFGSSGK